MLFLRSWEMLDFNDNKDKIIISKDSGKIV
jgi:hypothetical protein